MDRKTHGYGLKGLSGQVRRAALSALAALLAALFLAPCPHALAEDGALFGQPIPPDAAEIDLSGADISSAEACIQALAPFPNARRVKLGDSLPLGALYQVVTAYPQTAFDATFVVNRRTYATGDVAVDFGTKPPKSLDELDMVLSVLPNLQSLDMYHFEITVEQMEGLMKKYPGVHFGWTIPLPGARSLPSNATAYSTRRSHLIKEKDRSLTEAFAPLTYCPDLLALDLGHNAIDDLSFLRQFPHLKVLILADNRITDISVIGELTELEYLELFMNDITDLTPLAKLQNLKDLNLCYTEAADIDPLYELTGLERCWFSHAKVSGMDKARLKSRLKKTKFNFTAQFSTQDGWREGAHYKVIKKMFKGYTYIPFEE